MRKFIFILLFSPFFANSANDSIFYKNRIGMEGAGKAVIFGNIFYE